MRRLRQRGSDPTTLWCPTHRGLHLPRHRSGPTQGEAADRETSWGSDMPHRAVSAKRYPGEPSAPEMDRVRRLVRPRFCEEGAVPSGRTRPTRRSLGVAPAQPSPRAASCRDGRSHAPAKPPRHDRAMRAMTPQPVHPRDTVPPSRGRSRQLASAGGHRGALRPSRAMAARPRGSSSAPAVHRKASPPFAAPRRPKTPAPQSPHREAAAHRWRGQPDISTAVSDHPHLTHQVAAALPDVRSNRDIEIDNRPVSADAQRKVEAPTPRRPRPAP